MIVPFKGRELKDSPVEVYRNLNRRDGVWFSVRQDGKVIGHAQNLTLTDATFVVNRAGRARCLRTKQKNVHAWVRGVICPRFYQDGLQTRVYYRPYVSGFFHMTDMTEARNARLAVIGKDGITTWRLNEW